MQTVWKKLKNTEGTSILLAMILLLICTVVASTTLMASASGSSRNSNRVAQQRAYLAISSAADLMMDEAKSLSSGTFKAQSTKKVYSCTTTNHSNVGYSDYAVDASTSLTGALEELVKQGCLYFANPNNDNVPKNTLPYKKNITISLKNGSEQLPDVTCEFIMYNNYDIDLVFATPNSDYDYTLTIALSSNGKTSWVNQGSPNEECGCSYIVEILDEQDDGSVVTERREVKYNMQTSTKNLQITWGEPTLMKGAITT